MMMEFLMTVSLVIKSLMMKLPQLIVDSHTSVMDHNASNDIEVIDSQLNSKDNDDNDNDDDDDDDD